MTMDVTFFEDACYFSTIDPSLQGENHSYLEEKFNEIVINGVSHITIFCILLLVFKSHKREE